MDEKKNIAMWISPKLQARYDKLEIQTPIQDKAKALLVDFLEEEECKRFTNHREDSGSDLSHGKIEELTEKQLKEQNNKPANKLFDSKLLG